VLEKLPQYVDRFSKRWRGGEELYGDPKSGQSSILQLMTAGAARRVLPFYPA